MVFLSYMVLHYNYILHVDSFPLYADTSTLYTDTLYIHADAFLKGRNGEVGKQCHVVNFIY